jgi:preprotein translocase subunit Sss1
MDNKKIIYLVIGIVVIGGIGFAVYKIVNKTQENKTN